MKRCTSLAATFEGPTRRTDGTVVDARGAELALLGFPVRKSSNLNRTAYLIVLIASLGKVGRSLVRKRDIAADAAAGPGATARRTVDVRTSADE